MKFIFYLVVTLIAGIITTTNCKTESELTTRTFEFTNRTLEITSDDASSRQYLQPTAVINKGPIVTSLASLLAVKYWNTKRLRRCCASGRCPCHPGMMGGGAMGGMGGMGGPGVSSGMPHSPEATGQDIGDINYDENDQLNSFRPSSVQIPKPTRPRPQRVRPFQQRPQPQPTQAQQQISAPQFQQPWNSGNLINRFQPNQKWNSQASNGNNRPFLYTTASYDDEDSNNFDQISGGTFVMSKNPTRGKREVNGEFFRQKRSPTRRKVRRKTILKNRRKNSNGNNQSNEGQKERPSRRPRDPPTQSSEKRRNRPTNGARNRNRN